MAMKSVKNRSLAQSGERTRPIRRDLVLMVAGGAISLVTAASVMYWQTERVNSEQRHHKQIDALKEFNLQLGKLYDKTENSIRNAEAELDQVEKSYKERGHPTAEDGQRLIAVGRDMFNFGVENYSQSRAAEQALHAYFGKEVIEQATQPVREPIGQIIKRQQVQTAELIARIAASKTQEEYDILAHELVAIGRTQFTELKECIADERARLEVMNVSLMRLIDNYK
jgi:hypothetical protein